MQKKLKIPLTTNKAILPIIVVAQFCCTSLWFAGNGVMSDLASHFDLGQNALGHLTSMVQLGFITGTLVFAILTIADRFSPSKVFMISSLCAALFNVGATWDGNTVTTLFFLRFFTGFFLAGIYPVGMKIAADHYEKRLGKSLGFLVGALVIGTAFPHFLKGISQEFQWEWVLYASSLLAVLGGLLIGVRIPDGPYRKPGQHQKVNTFLRCLPILDFVLRHSDILGICGNFTRFGPLFH